MPPKKELKRQNIVTIKLTNIELDILNQAAISVGISRSEYLRKLIVNKPPQVHYEVITDVEMLQKLVGEYSKIGFNLNQIAEHFNTGGERPLAVENKIH